MCRQVRDTDEYIHVRHTLDTMTHRRVEDSGGVHPRLVVQEELVHVVAQIIVLADVLARALYRIGAR